MDLPRTKRQLRRYLGMYQFYSQFVQNCAKWLQPLHDLVAQSPNNRPLLWSENQKHSFQLSKVALVESTLLVFPYPAAKPELVTDARGDFTETVLEQVRNGSREPLAFWSKAFTRNQRKWSRLAIHLAMRWVSVGQFRSAHPSSIRV